MRYLAAMAAAMTLALMAPGQVSAQEDNPFDYIPADAGIIMCVNVQRVIESPVYKEATEKRKEQVQAGVDLVKRVFGLDPTRDLDSMWLWGKPQDRKSISVMIKGKLNQESLVNVLKAGQDYQTTEVKGLTVHQWYDRREGRVKFGAFLPGGSGIVFNELGLLEDALELKESGQGFMSGANAKNLPTNRDDAAVWAFMAKPEAKGRFKDTLQALDAGVSIIPTDRGVEARIGVRTESVAAAKGWADMARGALAFAKLQSTEARLRELAERIVVSVDETASMMAVELALTNDELFAMAKHRREKK